MNLNKRRDTEDKVFLAVLAFICLAGIVTLGVGAWIAIEITTWLTSK